MRNTKWLQKGSTIYNFLSLQECTKQHENEGRVLFVVVSVRNDVVLDIVHNVQSILIIVLVMMFVQVFFFNSKT